VCVARLRNWLVWFWTVVWHSCIVLYRDVCKTQQRDASGCHIVHCATGQPHAFCVMCVALCAQILVSVWNLLRQRQRIAACCTYHASACCSRQTRADNEGSRMNLLCLALCVSIADWWVAAVTVTMTVTVHLRYSSLRLWPCYVCSSCSESASSFECLLQLCIVCTGFAAYLAAVCVVSAILWQTNLCPHATFQLVICLGTCTLKPCGITCRCQCMMSQT
jgi:hypothetical protein